MRWGSVLMSVLSKDAVDWIQAFNKFASGSDYDGDKTVTSQPLPEEEEDDEEEEKTNTKSEDGVSSVEEVSVRQTKKPLPVFAKPAAAASCPNFPKPSAWRRPASPLPPTTSVSEPTSDFSVRQGQHSVATLRHILERKATLSLMGGPKTRHTLRD